MLQKNRLWTPIIVLALAVQTGESRMQPSVSACLLGEDRINGGLRNASGPLPTLCSYRPRTSDQACVYEDMTSLHQNLTVVDFE